MPSSDPVIPIESFQTFGDLLKYLRRRARLTQRELCIAVGYSEAQISRLEQNLRPPDLAALTALFIPALYLEDEPLMVTRLMELAAQARGEALPHNGTITFSRSVQRETKESVRTVEEELSNNLPLQLTSFIGREREIGEIKDLLSKARLVTLTGSGGCGKTRLALEVANHLTDGYSDGIWFIELASISDPVLVPQAITSILGLYAARDDSPISNLIKYFRTKHSLLIFDNCEQIVSGVTGLVEKILSNCPHVNILMTSREILNVPGEVRFRVPSLSLPQDASSNIEPSTRSESIQLFMERAQAVLPSFDLNKANAGFIFQICRRLDGMPLAIELAAARVSMLSVQQIAERLENNFQILKGGRKGLPRQETLQATIEWSYDLLSKSEMLLLQRLSIFSGGWDLDAAEAIASDSSVLPRENILDLLSQLVNKSLVMVEWQIKSEAHYRMLQTIHEFARGKLLASGQLEALRARHFDYYHATAHDGEEKLFATESSIDWAEAEIDNLRAALTWALEKDTQNPASEDRSRRGLELMGYIWPLWLSRGYLLEGNERMKQLLALHTTPTPARVRALLMLGDFARYLSDFKSQVTFFEEALALARKVGHKKQIAAALMEMGLLERDRPDYPTAVLRFNESLAMFQELNENLWVCRTSYLLAQAHMANGNLETARPLWEHGLDLSRKENDKWQIAWGLEGLGNIASAQGRFKEAKELYTESLNLKCDVMDKAGIIYSLEAFAQLAAAQKQFKRAAILWSAAEQLSQTWKLLVFSSSEELYISQLPMTREQLGETLFNEAWAQGQKLKMQQAIEYALDASDE